MLHRWLAMVLCDKIQMVKYHLLGNSRHVNIFWNIFYHRYIVSGKFILYTSSAWLICVQSRSATAAFWLHHISVSWFLPVPVKSALTPLCFCG